MNAQSYAALLRFLKARRERRKVESTGGPSLQVVSALSRYQQAASDLAELLADELERRGD